MYSMQDLIDLANDVLLPEITKIHVNFSQHVRTDCEVRNLNFLWIETVNTCSCSHACKIIIYGS